MTLADNVLGKEVSNYVPVVHFVREERSLSWNPTQTNNQAPDQRPLFVLGSGTGPKVSFGAKGFGLTGPGAHKPI